MDTQNPSGKKLSGLRTFAKDQEGKNNGAENKVVFVESSQATIDKELKKIHKEPEIFETTEKELDVEVPPPPKEPEIFEINNTNNFLKEDVGVVFDKKPTPTEIPRITRKTDSDIAIEDNDEVGGATIITDTKKDRFKLFPAIGESLKNWVQDIRDAQEEKKKPRYTVPETTRRKGVIQKATSQTGKITSADHSTLQERIRQRLEKEVVKYGNDESSESHVTWTPNTETGFLLLEEPEGGVSNVQVVPRKNFYTNQQEIIVRNRESNSRSGFEIETKTEPEPEPILEAEKLPEEQTTPENITVIEDLITDTDKKETYSETSEETVEKSGFEIFSKPTEEAIASPVTESTVEEISSLNESETNSDRSQIEEKFTREEESEPIDIIDQDNQPEDDVKYERKNRPSNNFLSRVNTNLLSFIIALVALLALFFSGLGNTLIENQISKTSSNITNYPKAINSDIKFVSTQKTSREDFIQKILNEIESSDTTQFVFTTDEQNREIIKPSILLSRLGFNLEANFSQSITNVYFGSLHRTNPYIALKITDATNARGGLLIWEKNMRYDLFPIFKLKNDSTIANRTFIDGMLGGVDVRVLKDNNGEEEIIYGFVNRDTIIITKNTATFSELLELIPQ
jgi:hypothetical protein